MSNPLPIHEAAQHSAVLESSINALLALACEETHADTFALRELNTLTGQLVLIAGYGDLRRDKGAVDAPSFLIQSSELIGRTGPLGTLEFGFLNIEQLSAAQKSTLKRTADSIAALLEYRRGSMKLKALAARIGQMEARLADIKITERATGLIHQSSKNGKTELLHAHIASVLNYCEFEKLLTTTADQYQQKIDERLVLAQASSYLQRSLRITEEQAYLKMREISRQSRVKLAVVAQEILASAENLVDQEKRPA